MTENKYRGPACLGCGRFDANVPWDIKTDCRLCWLWFHSDRNRASWGTHPFGDQHRRGDAHVTELVGALPEKELCVHVDDTRQLSREQMVELKLNPAKNWVYCGKGLTKNPQKVPGVVCPCSGCGPKCKQYAAGSE